MDKGFKALREITYILYKFSEVPMCERTPESETGIPGLRCLSVRK